MKSFHLISVITLLAGSAYASVASAVIDDTAAVVSVRTDCTEAGLNVDNCFTSFSDLTSWFSTTRLPNADAPIVVNVGPGTFDGNGTHLIVLQCNSLNGYVGHISFVGAGRQQTILTTGNGITVLASSCTKLDFSNLTIDSYGTSGGSIQWNGGGDSKWSNVDVTAVYYGWNESVCGVTSGSHYWFGSHIIAKDNFGVAIAYKSKCDVSWFYGSEITETSSGGYVSPYGMSVLDVTGNGEVHVYGSAIRAISNKTGPSGAVVSAVRVSGGGDVHIHGTGIDVISSVPNNLVVLDAKTGGMIHANVSSYNLSTTSGTVTRIRKDADPMTHVHAPYLWEHVPDAATIPGYTSVTGADMTTVTTGTSDGHPHVLVYDAACLSKWYDTGDKVCKP